MKSKLSFIDIVIVVILVALIILSSTRIVTISKVSGESMQPTLYDKDIGIVIKSFDGYKNGDIVVFKSKSDILLIKRVIAVGGQSVSIQGGKVFVDNKEIKEEYLGVQSTNEMDLTETVIVPKGCYMVMGDNRENSLDSRYDEIGFIKEHDILGKYRVTLKGGKKNG